MNDLFIVLQCCSVCRVELEAPRAERNVCDERQSQSLTSWHDVYDKGVIVMC